MNSRLVIVITFASALLLPTLASRSFPTIGLESAWVPIIFAFGLGATASWLAANRLAALFAAFLLGVPFGIFLDVLVDWFVFSRDRNLFPFEIFGWVKIFAIPGIIGVFLGRVARSMGDNTDEKAI